jgi:hypothetical protein
MRDCASEVWSGACHRAALRADPLGPSRNDQRKKPAVIGDGGLALLREAPSAVYLAATLTTFSWKEEA